MQIVDLKRELKHLYQPSAKEVVQVQVPSLNFLMIDGEGDPNTSQAYADTVETLFAVSYAIKFMVKKGTLAIDYGVMPLEGQRWLSKIGLADKWRTCSDGCLRRPHKESRNEKAQKEPHGGIQGESRGCGAERRQDIG
jgi:hypothetical protein